jgi:hypothetical protein
LEKINDGGTEFRCSEDGSTMLRRLHNGFTVGKLGGSPRNFSKENEREKPKHVLVFSGREKA